MKKVTALLVAVVLGASVVGCTKPSPSPSPTPSPTPSVAPSATPSPSPSASTSPSPEASPSGSPEASPSGSPEASPSGSPEASPSGSPEASPSGSPEVSPSASASTVKVSEGAPLKLGVAAIASLEKSADVTADKEGLAQADINIATVLVDDKGVIVDCIIDSVQSKVSFDKSGKVTYDLKKPVLTKIELGTDYGMGKASGIKKEWDEQITAFSEYVVGKTASEVKGIKLTDKKAPDVAELSASVTMSVDGYMAVIEKAVANAKDIGSKGGDVLGLGIETNAAKSTNATADKAGLAQADCTFVATTTDKDGKITAAVLDGIQGNVNFDASGKITSDLKKAPQTKNELGAAYGMAKVSSIGKEWNEQAGLISMAIVGRTVEEMKGISLNEKGAPADAELAASVTISVKDFITVIEESVNGIK